MDGDQRPGRRPAPGAGGTAHRVGEVGGVLRRDGAAAGARCRADGDRVTAARADAQPGRGGGPGRDPRTHDQLRQHAGVGPRLRGGRGRPGRRAAGQPRTPEQPWLPRPGAAEAHRRGGPDRDRRGPLHLRLGPRLPPRLPADPHAAAGSSAGDPGAGDHRDRERPGHPRCRRATWRGPRLRRRTRAARPAGPGVAAPRGGEPADRPPAARLAGGPAHRRRLAGIRDHLHANGRRGLRDGGVPPRPGNRRRRVQRP